jgi:hypothetical protein
MPVQLQNLTTRPVLLTLSTGETLRLSPGETSETLEDVEVRGSTKLEKLISRSVITMQEHPRRSSARKAGKSTKSDATTTDSGESTTGSEPSADVGAEKTNTD